MAKTIVQKIVFKNTSPAALYDLYMDAKKHTASTGSPATITQKEGAAYDVHNSYITGKNLQLIKDKLIVQSWRAADWAAGETESVFIIQLEEKGNDTILNVVHANLPDANAEAIDKGWHDYYWKPWKQYLKGGKVATANM